MRTPRGLPNVYFCAHPNDFPKYLDRIAADILDCASCAVWYDADHHSRAEDELFSALETMALFVIPISSSLLSSECRALREEAAFARKTGIPILPIMTEEGLEAQYCRIFGEAQFLPISEIGEGALTYREKLSRFLERTVSGSDLCERISREFDASVFISYRKKDRRYANELIRTMHKSASLRDVAVWYDEYLIPGEQFHDSIRDAFEKSSLFLLCASPSIAEKIRDIDGNEKENYVVEKEYPMALGSKKPIIAVNVCGPEESLLKQKFKSLPPCIDIGNEERLHSDIIDALYGDKRGKRKDSAIHRFLIGLAYLNGIGTERDPERGISLITSAAEEGELEAVERLVSVYELGIGAPPDARLEIEWRRRLILELEKKFQKSNAQADTVDIINESLALVSRLNAAGSSDEAIAECRIALSRARSFCKAYENNPPSLVSLSSVLTKLCELLISSDMIEEAEALLGEATDMIEGFSDHSDSFLIKRETASSLILLGRINEKRGSLPKARLLYEKARGLYEGIYEENKFLFISSGLALSYLQLGGAEKQLGNIKSASDAFSKATDILSEANEFSASDSTVLALASGLIQCGSALAEGGSAEKAYEHCEKAISLCQRVAEGANQYKARQLMMSAFKTMGASALDSGETKKAREYYTAFGELAAKQAKDEKSTDIARAELQLGAVDEEENNLRAAEAHYEKAVRIYSRVAESNGSAEAQHDLAMSISRLACIKNGLGNRENAKALYKNALGIYNSLSKSFPSVYVLYQEACLHRDIGAIARAEGELSEAKRHFSRETELLCMLSGQNGDASLSEDLAAAYCRLATVQDEDEATVSLKKAYEAYKLLHEEQPENERYSELLDIFEKELPSELL